MPMVVVVEHPAAPAIVAAPLLGMDETCGHQKDG
jgi:hypothetical protein